MALEGTLKDFSLADIFQLIGIQRKTGVLTLKNEADVVTVTFQDGNVVSADSQEKKLEDLLGSVLVKSGTLTEVQLQDALKTQRRTLQRLGNILIQERRISHADLSNALRLQVTQVVYRLFRWKDGDYSFKQESAVEYDREHFSPLSAESILMEGIRMIDEWPIIEKKIRSVGMVFVKTRPSARVDVQREEGEEDEGDELSDALTGSVPAATRPARPPSGDAVVVSEREAHLYQLIDGEMSVQDLIDRAGLGDFETCRVLYDLLTRGIIREVKTEPQRKVEASPPRARVSGAFWNFLAALVVLGAAISFATMGLNPLNRIPPAHADPVMEEVLTAITRSHVKRLDEAIQVYYLQKGFLPDDVAELRRGALIPAAALRDAWGRRLGYEPGDHGYRVVAYGPDGEEIPGLSLDRRSRRPGGRSPR